MILNWGYISLIVSVILFIIILFVSIAVSKKIKKQNQSKEIKKSLKVIKAEKILKDLDNPKQKRSLFALKEKIIKFDLNNKLYTKEQFIDGEFYSKLIPKDYLKSLSGYARWRMTRKFRKAPHKYVLVRMNMLNNTQLEFLAPMKADGFMLGKDKQFIFDDTNKFFLANSSMWCYEYHEEMAIPIKVKTSLPTPVKEYLEEYEKEMKKPSKNKISIEKIQSILENAKTTQIKASLNPSTLRAYLKSNFIQGLVAGASLGRIFRIIIILSVIILIITVISMVTNLYNSGIFENIINNVK